MRISDSYSLTPSSSTIRSYGDENRPRSVAGYAVYQRTPQRTLYPLKRTRLCDILLNRAAAHSGMPTAKFDISYLTLMARARSLQLKSSARGGIRLWLLS